MAELYLFNPGLSEFDALKAYTQDNATGFPVSSQTDADKIYKDTYPQRIELTETASVGSLLNIYFKQEKLYARMATSRDKIRYCNSMALEAGAPGDIIHCAVKSATIPAGGTKGAAYLSYVPGQTVAFGSPMGSGEIIQKVGEYVDGWFYFYFHTPALRNPMSFSYLKQTIN